MCCMCVVHCREPSTMLTPSWGPQQGKPWGGWPKKEGTTPSSHRLLRCASTGRLLYSHHAVRSKLGDQYLHLCIICHFLGAITSILYSFVFFHVMHSSQISCFCGAMLLTESKLFYKYFIVNFGLAFLTYHSCQCMWGKGLFSHLSIIIPPLLGHHSCDFPATLVCL